MLKVRLLAVAASSLVFIQQAYAMTVSHQHCMNAWYIPGMVGKTFAGYMML